GADEDIDDEGPDAADDDDGADGPEGEGPAGFFPPGVFEGEGGGGLGFHFFEESDHVAADVGGDVGVVGGDVRQFSAEGVGEIAPAAFSGGGSGAEESEDLDGFFVGGLAGVDFGVNCLTSPPTTP